MVRYRTRVVRVQLNCCCILDNTKNIYVCVIWDVLLRMTCLLSLIKWVQIVVWIFACCTVVTRQGQQFKNDLTRLLSKAAI